SFWTFSDIFEESYFPSVPFHGGFGLLNLQGVPKPNYRAFELLHRLGTDLLPVTGSHPTVDAWAVRRDGSVTVLLTSHVLPRHPIQKERVQIELTDAAEPRAARLERIDEEHANAKRAWVEMGQPEYLSAGEVEQLQQASRLVREPCAWKYEKGTVRLDVAVPPH